MARPQVVDGGDGLQIWKLAANILNKQSGTVDKGRFSNLRIRRGSKYYPPLNTLNVKFYGVQFNQLAHL
jgi:hypothetical protein